MRVVGLLVGVMVIKGLNGVVLGGGYGENLGVNIGGVGKLLLLGRGLVSGVRS